jgi:hypothetical protein
MAMIVLDFPHEVIWWAIFAGLSFIALTAMPFFKTDPLTWNCIISFWTLFGTYFIWTGSMGVCIAKDASRRLRQESEPDARILACARDLRSCMDPENVSCAANLRIRRILSGREIGRSTRN